MKETNFKHTDIGDIPHDWNVVQLGEIGYTYNGITGKSAKDFGKGEAAYITFLNVLNNPIIDTSILESVDIAKSESQNSVKKGDLFFNTSSETPEDVGTCAVLLEDVDNVYLNSFCFGYRLTDSSILGKYLAYYFRSTQGRNLMTKLAQGATRYNLSKVNFNNSYIPLPPTLAEQERITTALSDMDNLIAHLDLMIDKKQLIKQGAMQQLLSGKTRLKGFSQPWKEIKLGEVCNIVKGEQLNRNKMSEVADYPVYNGGISCSGYHSDFNTEAETLIISEGGNSCGFVNYIHERFWRGGHCYGLLGFNGDNNFFYQMLKFREKDIMKLRAGSGLPNIQRNSLNDFCIDIPSKQTEQQAIASVLTAMDEEIQSLQSQRDKYALIKQGMMQQLLTGKTRI